MRKIIKVNDTQWAELDKVEEPPITPREALSWLAGLWMMVGIILLICVLGGILQGGACK